MSMKIRLESGKHTCFGSLDQAGSDGESEHSITRPVMLVYTGKFESIDGPVEVSEEHIDRLIATHNSVLARAKRLMTGGMPVFKECPPLQLDHSSSAAMTVGRVTGDLRKGIHKDEEFGTDHPAVYGEVTVLGRENVERVKDGRWTHVSIGADLNTGKLNELSITPFPAAAKASLLKGLASGDSLTDIKNKKSSEDVTMLEKLKNALKSAVRFASDKEVDEHIGKMKKHLMEQHKLSEEDADKHMAGMDDEKRMSIEAEMAKMAEAPPAEEPPKPGKDLDTEEAKEKEHKMAASKAEFIKLAKGFKTQSDVVRLEAKKVGLQARLSGLRASAKITPAEIKKIDLVKLAGQNDATINAVFESYELREPQVLAGVISTKKAQDVAEIAAISAKLRKESMEKQSKANMPFTGTALSNMNPSKAKLGEPMPNASGPTATSHMGQEMPPEHMEAHYSNICKMMDEGRHDEAKQHLRQMIDQITAPNQRTEDPDGAPASMQAQMSALANNVENMHNEFEALVKLVGPNMGVESSELN